MGETEESSSFLEGTFYGTGVNAEGLLQEAYEEVLRRVALGRCQRCDYPLLTTWRYCPSCGEQAVIVPLA